MCTWVMGSAFTGNVGCYEGADLDLCPCASSSETWQTARLASIDVPCVESDCNKSRAVIAIIKSI